MGSQKRVEYDLLMNTTALASTEELLTAELPTLPTP